jgi:hypothetical protein
VALMKETERTRPAGKTVSIVDNHLSNGPLAGAHPISEQDQWCPWSMFWQSSKLARTTVGMGEVEKPAIRVGLATQVTEPEHKSRMRYSSCDPKPRKAHPIYGSEVFRRSAQDNAGR